MRLPLALYRNRSNSPIDLRIGERPGEPPFVYAAGLGEAVEGPANYERAFVSAGFFLEKQLGDGELTAPQAWPGTSPKTPPKAAETVPSPAEPDSGVGVTIGAQPAVLLPEEHPPQKPPPKKRGG